MSEAPPFGFSIMRDGSVQSGDCSGMTLTPEFAQAALGGGGLPSDKEEMKSAHCAVALWIDEWRLRPSRRSWGWLFWRASFRGAYL